VGNGSIRTFAWGALGALELGLGRYGPAAVELRKVAELLSKLKMRHPGLIRWAPDLIEALAHLGTRHEAQQVLRTLEVQTERVGTPWAKAAVSRCRGILADDDFEGHFEAALRTHQQDVLPFERARTELAYGERLRRSRRRADSRAHLREALQTFERLGAPPWVDRASAELRATGERARRRDPTTALDLTPQEHMVADAVAQGATNKEVAATLFLSPKTVESHLSRIYVKLGVRSRTQLTHRWNMSSK
jgi:DNA-binding CsgD family transcriptional regulator